MLFECSVMVSASACGKQKARKSQMGTVFAACVADFSNMACKVVDFQAFQVC